MGTDPDEPSLVGTVLAQRYRLLSRLGGGGMGEVYRAVNESVGREVAIKILRPELARHRDTVSRFVREARAANAVRHPNVVDVLDVATAEDGTPFLVQELLKGTDLSAPLAARGRVSCAEALDWMLPVVDAIAAAHTQGLMHRDLKPENVFLAEQNNGTVMPKVLDFGLSRSVDDRSQRVTATGVTMGTPGYMSPEQIIGASTIDVRTDVWALGVMLYELMAGVLPFTAETPGALFLRICTADPIPLATAAPWVPTSLCDVVMRCLVREPSGRFDDARALLVALRAERPHAPTEAPPPMPPRPVPAPTDLASGATLSAPGVDPLTTLGPPHRRPAPSPGWVAPPAVVSTNPPSRKSWVLLGVVMAFVVVGGVVAVATHQSAVPAQTSAVRESVAPAPTTPIVAPSASAEPAAPSAVPPEPSQADAEVAAVAPPPEAPPPAPPPALAARPVVDRPSRTTHGRRTRPPREGGTTRTHVGAIEYD